MFETKLINMKKIKKPMKKYYLKICLENAIEYTIWNNYEVLNKIRRDIMERKKALDQNEYMEKFYLIKFDCDCVIDVSRVIMMVITDKTD